MDMMFPGGGFPGTGQTTAVGASEGTVFWCRSIAEGRERKLAPSCRLSSLPWGALAEHSTEGGQRDQGEEEDQHHFPSSPIAPTLHQISVFPQRGAQLLLRSHCQYRERVPGVRHLPQPAASQTTPSERCQGLTWPPAVAALVSTLVLGCYSCHLECQPIFPLFSILNDPT